MIFGLDTQYIQTIFSIIRIIYPLIQSLKFLKKKDSEGINAVLKYWCLNWVLSFVENILPYLFNDTVSFLVMIGLQIFLVYDKFRGSSILFRILITPLMDRYNGQLQEFFEYIETKLRLKTQEGIDFGKQHLKEKFIPAMQKQATNALVQGLAQGNNNKIE